MKVIAVIVVLVFGAVIVSAVEDARLSRQYCPFDDCMDYADGPARWDCFSEKLYAPIAEDQSPSDEFYVQHDCHRVGWGNSVRGFYVTAALAMTTGRRLSIYHPQFNNMFDSPKGAKSWEYGLFDTLNNDRSGSKDVEAARWWGLQDRYVHQWDYSDHESAISSWEDMVTNRSVAELSSDERFTSTILGSGMCGGGQDYVMENSCMQKLMPNFINCLKDGDWEHGTHIDEALVPSPWFGMSFSKPNAKMVQFLDLMRKRIGLPALKPGVEPVPGQWGLHTPGFYILALHFRNIPVGFEPVAIDLRQGFQDTYKQSVSDGFWKHARETAIKAKKLAECRNEEFIIYFATDDPYNLRERAESTLGDIGRVVYGLSKEDVGHMYPNWEDESESQLEAAISAKSVKGLGSNLHGVPISSKDQAVESVDAMIEEDVFEEDEHGEDGEGLRDPLPSAREEEFTYHKGERHVEAVDRHGDWAIAEWFALSSAQWLVGHSGSSYAETAAGLGLSHIGHMERFDMVHGVGHAVVSSRVDWEKDSCSYVGAADPAQRDSCPNKTHAEERAGEQSEEETESEM